MFGKIQDQLQWRADLLLAERYEDMSREYLLPLALYLGDRLIVLPSQQAVITLAQELRAVLHARAVYRCQITLKAVELPRDGRFRVWGTWQELSHLPAQTRRSEVIYYMRETWHGMRSEMLHFTKVGPTELLDHPPTGLKIA